MIICENSKIKLLRQDRIFRKKMYFNKYINNLANLKILNGKKSKSNKYI